MMHAKMYQKRSIALIAIILFLAGFILTSYNKTQHKNDEVFERFMLDYHSPLRDVSSLLKENFKNDPKREISVKDLQIIGEKLRLTNHLSKQASYLFDDVHMGWFNYFNSAASYISSWTVVHENTKTIKMNETEYLFIKDLQRLLEQIDTKIIENEKPPKKPYYSIKPELTPKDFNDLLYYIEKHAQSNWDHINDLSNRNHGIYILP